MKKLIGNIVWLVPFCLMVSTQYYPQVSGVAQSLIWVLIVLVALALPIVIVAVCVTEKKEDIKKWAKKKSWYGSLFAWFKTLAMFAAIALAGLTVAAGFYLMLSLACRLIPAFAQQRLEKMEEA